MKVVHEQDKRFKCNFCVKRFRTKSGLQGHINNAHEGKNPYPCTVCDLGFVTERSLKYHVKSVHENNNTQEIVPEVIKIKEEPMEIVEIDQEMEVIHNENEEENYFNPGVVIKQFWAKRMEKIYRRKEKFNLSLNLNSSGEEISDDSIDSPSMQSPMWGCQEVGLAF